MPKEEVEETEEKKEAAEATVLGLGVEGGFKLDSQKYDVVKEYALAVRLNYMNGLCIKKNQMDHHPKNNKTHSPRKINVHTLLTYPIDRMQTGAGGPWGRGLTGGSALPEPGHPRICLHGRPGSA